MIVAPTVVADCLVNLFGAIGAVVLAREATRNEPAGPMTRRIRASLYFVGALFLIRSIAWWLQNSFALNFADVVAVLTPLVSLFVAEGLLRRHAPLWMKQALLVGPALIVIAKAFPLIPDVAVTVILIVSVVGGYLAIAFLLWRRDTTSLTVAENVSIQRVLMALVVLAPFIMSDFRSLWPDVPVRLGALGALLWLYLVFGSGNLQARMSARIATLLGFTTIAGLLAFGYQLTIGSDDFAQIFRVGVVCLAGLICAAIFSEARGAQSERSRPLPALLSARTQAEFESGLRSHALLGGSQVLAGAAIEHACHPAFQSLIEDRGILTRADAPWGRAVTDDGVELALSLMAAHEATDLAFLTRSPLRVLAVALPAIARDARSESEIQLARLVGELSYGRAVPS